MTFSVFNRWRCNRYFPVAQNQNGSTILLNFLALIFLSLSENHVKMYIFILKLSANSKDFCLSDGRTKMSERNNSFKWISDFWSQQTFRKIAFAVICSEGGAWRRAKRQISSKRELFWCRKKLIAAAPYLWRWQPQSQAFYFCYTIAHFQFSQIFFEYKSHLFFETRNIMHICKVFIRKSMSGARGGREKYSDAIFAGNFGLLTMCE